MASIEEQRKRVAAFRDAFRGRPNHPVLLTQRAFPQRAPVKGNIWVAEDDIQLAGEDGVADSLFRVVNASAVEPVILPAPSEEPARDVHVEWVGRRRDAAAPGEKRSASSSDNFQKLQSDLRSELTIMFAHGGAFYIGSSATSRATTTKLARLTEARVISVDYRLAPQNQFPGQLLDFLLVYLALIYPPPGSKHSPVSPSNIVLAGESSGGGLCLSLIQYIVLLRRMQRTSRPIVRFGGRDVHVPMPAGAAVLSAEADRSLGLRSWKENGDVDFLQEIQPANAPTQPPDEIWPSHPARHDVYCHASAFLHPIANPAVATDWAGSPPLWIAYGQERCLDGGKLIASTAAGQGVAVQFSEYTGLPHIFAIVLSDFPQSKVCMAEWAAVCRDMARGVKRASSARRISSSRQPGDTSTELKLDRLLDYSVDEAMLMICAATKARKLYLGNATTSRSLL